MERKMDNTDCARRLENYQHFVEQISQALGVPEDSLILPYAQSLRAELAAVTAERDALRAKVAAVPWEDIYTAYSMACALSILGTEDSETNEKLERIADWLEIPEFSDGD
jgi:hypothetical protein